jgi:hypothetical protein
VLDQNIHALAWGPLRIVKTWPIYFVNGFKFHIKAHSIGKSTMNCGVCVKGTCYGEYENDFYGQLEEIIQIEFPGTPLKGLVIKVTMRYYKFVCLNICNDVLLC